MWPVKSAKAAINAPTNLTATAVSISQIDLSWTDNSNNESMFFIERSLSEASGFIRIKSVPANQTTFSNINLNPNTTYYYRVQAYPGYDPGSDYSNVAYATTSSNETAPPTDLSATAISNTEIKLQWTDNSQNEYGFKIERADCQTCAYTQIDSVNQNITTYTNSRLPALANPRTFYYRVRAYGTVGDTAYTNIASATLYATIPNITLQKTANPSSIIPGGTITYTITATNIGWAEAMYIVINDQIDASLLNIYTIKFLEGPVGLIDFDTNRISWDLGGLILARNEQTQISFSIKQEPTPVAIPLLDVRDVISDGSYAYLVLQTGLAIVDVSDPLVARTISKINSGLTYPTQISKDQNLAVIAYGNKGLVIFDVSNPSNPIILKTMSNRAKGVVVKGNYAYIIDDMAGYLRVIDLNNPSSPVIVANLQIGGVPLDISIDGNSLYIANSGSLKIVDISTPRAPQVIGTGNFPCGKVTAKPGFAYIDGTPNGGIQVVNTSNLSDIKIVGQLDLFKTIKDLAVSGNYLYGANQDARGGFSGLLIADVSIPTSPSTVKEINTTQNGAFQVAISGSSTYLADSTNGLVIFDVSDPNNAKIVRTVK